MDLYNKIRIIYLLIKYVKNKIFDYHILKRKYNDK